METLVSLLIVIWMALHICNHYQKEKILWKTIKELEEKVSSIK
jgi:hypothetical protein